jgi:hypothetical protein
MYTSLCSNVNNTSSVGNNAFDILTLLVPVPARTEITLTLVNVPVIGTGISTGNVDSESRQRKP